MTNTTLVKQSVFYYNVTEELDKVASLKITRRRPSKPITKFLSPAAKSAKRERRRRERIRRSTKLESDRVAYRRSCRTANRLINESRTDFMRKRLSMSPSIQNKNDELLRTCSTLTRFCQMMNVWAFVLGFLFFFVAKICNLKRAIMDKTILLTNMQPFQERDHFGPKAQNLMIFLRSPQMRLKTVI